jgi:hypothetical protein
MPQVHLRLVRCGWITGKLQGQFEPGEVVRCTDTVDEATAAVDRNRRFTLGPLRVGPATLVFKGKRSEIVGQRLAVREGRQDIGELVVTSFGSLSIEVGPAGHVRGPLWIVMYLMRDRDHQRGLEGVGELQVNAQSKAVIENFRAGEFGALLWSANGFRGELSVVVTGKVRRDVSLNMDPPGSVMVRVSGVPLPSGCAVLAVDRAHALRPGSVELDAPRRPHLRVREATVDANGSCCLDALWPGEYDVSLLSPDGVPLRHEVVRVPSRTDVTVVMPVLGVAALRLRNLRQDTALRYALLAGDGGVIVRGGVVAGGERCLVALPPGTLRLLEWRSEGGAGSESTARSHDVRLEPGTEVAVELGR